MTKIGVPAMRFASAAVSIALCSACIHRTVVVPVDAVIAARAELTTTGRADVLDASGVAVTIERDQEDTETRRALGDLVGPCDDGECELRRQERVTVREPDAGATALMWTSVGLLVGLITTIVIVASAASDTGTDSLAGEP
jgi:hypothetical protein